ncbi:MAG: hypothetical protein Q7V40_23800, partial [Pseudolabrys sp.]|nr:hypothetical protein [Pseudolabrys sp.]
SIARRRPVWYRTDFARHTMRRWTVAAHDFSFTLRRAPPLVVMGALAVIVAATSAFLLFKAPSTSSRAGISETSKTTKPAPAAGSINANAGLDVAPNWTKLEPAYKSFKIQVGNDNTLLTDQHAIELYGVNILPRNQICTYSSGERWACGQRTYIALLNILGAATVDCRPQQENQPRIVVCHLGGRDIAELMLREGWATLANGVTEQHYMDAATAASTNKNGMWSLQASKR